MLPPNQPKNTYDLTPFLSAASVQIRAQENHGEVHILTIPATKIPSPLARYIPPEKIIDLKEYLCGPTPLLATTSRALDGTKDVEGLFGPVASSNNQSTMEDTTTARIHGPEIWASWKRAFDLWNGFFIEGRINKAWLGSEYVRIEKAVNGSQWPNNGFSIGEDDHEADINGIQKWICMTDEEDGTESYILNSAWKAAREKQAYEVKLDSISLGGGFFPMKDLKEFVTTDDEGWVDNLQNTVWRPKRLGEDKEKPIVDIDDDVDQWFEKQIVSGVKDETGFNGWIDGGVDCGRSPFPVLRPRTKYVRQAPVTNTDHCYSKHISWDGVTSTIFNMPINPLPVSKSPEEMNLEDMRQVTIQTAFGDSLRDPRAESYGWSHKGTFPLDIRRVLRTMPRNKSASTSAERVQTIHSNEVLELDDEFPLSEQRSMQRNDPWFVTEDQRQKRDEPTRFQPPSMVKYHKEVSNLASLTQKNDLIPVDADAWEAEKIKDDDREAEYFVANLHGAPLLINGIEIPRGYVAGPLPAFAVIECGNGQVAFWWGVEGRDYGNCGPLVGDDQTWAALRNRPGWAHIAQPAGDVWREKIAERRNRERTGDDLVDDEFWRSCKKAWNEENEVWDLEPKIGGIPKTWNGQPGNPALSFASPRDEFKHLVLKTELRRIQKELEQCRLGAVFPEGDAAWQGGIRTLKPTALASQDAALKYWADNADFLLRRQRAHAEMFKPQKQREGNTKSLNKRKLDGNQESPHPKKARYNDEEKSPSQPSSEWQERSDAAALALYNDKNEDNAQIVSRQLGQPKSMHKAVTKEYLKEKIALMAREDRGRSEANRLRRSKNLPELPIRYIGFRIPDLEKRIQEIRNVYTSDVKVSTPISRQTSKQKLQILDAHQAKSKAMEQENRELAKRLGDIEQRSQENLARQSKTLEPVAQDTEAEEKMKTVNKERKSSKLDMDALRAARLNRFELKTAKGTSGISPRSGRFGGYIKGLGLSSKIVKRTGYSPGCGAGRRQSGGNTTVSSQSESRNKESRLASTRRRDLFYGVASRKGQPPPILDKQNITTYSSKSLNPQNTQTIPTPTRKWLSNQNQIDSLDEYINGDTDMISGREYYSVDDIEELGGLPFEEQVENGSGWRDPGGKMEDTEDWAQHVEALEGDHAAGRVVFDDRFGVGLEF